MKVTFHGVRGSCPCPCEANTRYGGNTACVALEVDGAEPILLDLGTGLRMFGENLAADGTFRASALVTHIHWDHVQGLPFFPPIHAVGARLDVYGPHQQDGSFAEVFGGLMRRPYFPVHFSELLGDITFHDVTDEVIAIGEAKVTVRPVPHNGPTVGYRIEWDGSTVAYISDHQAPPTLDTIDDRVLELAADADLLIHDAQYTPEEFRQKADWGHCTIDYAIRVAKEARAKHLVLFHHDPAHSDDQLDRLYAEARSLAESQGVPAITAAAEGLTLTLS